MPAGHVASYPQTHVIYWDLVRDGWTAAFGFLSDIDSVTFAGHVAIVAVGGALVFAAIRLVRELV